MASKIKFSKIILTDDLRAKIDRKDWIKYLVLVNWHYQDISKSFGKINDAEFEKYVTKKVDDYLAGKMPPAEIAGAIMNIVDEHLSGDNISLRAGDYIALQTQFRAERPK